MKVLIIGAGGREHAIVWKILQSKNVEKVYCAPGNAGISKIACLAGRQATCVDIKADDIFALKQFVIREKIDFTIVGPEVPLVRGIVNEFQKDNLKIFGPTKEAAILEGSKVFTKEFLKRHNIPTANFKAFDNYIQAVDYLKSKNFPQVIKVDGLAAGKGVVVASSLKEAEDFLNLIFNNKIFGESGSQVIIEDCLEGEEASILVISDGKNFIPLASSQDHKRIFDKDEGPNTGGMGAYSPAPVVTDELFKQILEKIVRPTIDGMQKENRKFSGILYVGVMLTKEGPKVLEYNVRFGDPETQAILPRLNTDLLEVMQASSDGNLQKFGKEFSWDARHCLCVVAVSGGYPGKFEKGKEITGLDRIKEIDAAVFHAGTKLDLSGKIVTDGGRVLSVCSLGETLKIAQEKAYTSIKKIKFEDMHYRTDIGWRALGKIYN
ncbi:MAG: phosphoribosylamine--glycine ligase [Candidatus Omnitrophota bacterium]